MSGSWSPTLSEDGRRSAYVSDRGGMPQVWVEPGSVVPTGSSPVIAVRWSPCGAWLACEIAPGGAPRHELWLVRPDGSDLRQVAGFGADSAENMRWLPGRSLLAVTENLTTALVIDPATGSRTVVAEGSLISLLDVGPSGVLLRHGPRGSRFLAVGKSFVTHGEDGVFGPDGQTVFARSEAGEFPVLTRDREVIAASETADVEDFALTTTGGTAAVLWNRRGGTSELTILDLVTGGRLPVPLPGLVVSSPSWSADGSTLTFAASGPGRPWGVWTFDDSGLHPVSAPPAAPEAVQPVLHTFASHDGLEISGWLYRPDSTPSPTVLWFHGGPESQERPGHDPLFQALVARGIAVFAPNVRGSSGFGRSFVNADNGALRYAAIDDVASCAEYLVSSGIAPAGRIGCMGRSYGGYLTLAALVRFPELFAVGVDICGMSNFFSFYEHTEPWIAAAAVSKYGDPVADVALLKDLSPLTHIDALRAPLLVVHGANDSNVPVIEAEQIVEALRARGVPHKYLLFPDEGHELLHRSSRATFLRETVDWLSAHLRPGGSRPSG
ncbi:prolyl oligopeptidase family serine peptidase [Actinoplanes sp. NPDC051343]|uniref:S9 family peptidase n=1 Tax=Actinoplanes sp. NPDC051343 TaxID=3363906 RepID=UPI00378CB4BF